MPFLERSRMSLKQEFVMQAIQENANISRLCRRYDVTRTTGYKWVKRFLNEGEGGLVERSRRRGRIP